MGNSIKKFFNIAISVSFIVYIISSMFIFVIPQVKANPTTYYVKTTGDDGNAGTGTGDGEAFQTIQKAVNVSTNGDTIYVMAGTYVPWNGQIRIVNKVASNTWLTITNYQNDIVLVDGSNCPTSGGSTYWDGVIEVYESKYIRISGIDVNHSKRGGITIYDDSGPDCYYITVDNCSITNSSTWAVLVYSGNNITVENCYTYDCQNNWSGYQCGQEAISFTHVVDFSINNNTLINNRMVNIDCKAGCNSGDISYNIVNTTGGYAKEADTDLEYYGGQGIYLDANTGSGLITHNITIRNNLVYGNNTGICVGNEGSGGHFENISVYNNVVNVTGGGSYWNGRQALLFHNNGGSSQVHREIYAYSNTITTKSDNTYNPVYVGDFTSSNTDEWYIANNIIYTAYTGVLALVYIPDIDSGDGVIDLFNNSYNRTSGTISITWDDGTFTSGANPEKFGSDPLFTNPDFVSFDSDLSLQSSSPCVDTGNSSLVPNVDFDDTSRPQGSGNDRGAYEYEPSSSDYAWAFVNTTGVSIFVLARNGDLLINGTLHENDVEPGNAVFCMNNSMWLTESGDLYITGEEAVVSNPIWVVVNATDVNILKFSDAGDLELAGDLYENS